MRIPIAFSALLLLAAPLHAQDATQQANDLAQQNVINQQVQQNNQQALETSQRFTQAMIEASNCADCNRVSAPQLSLKSGIYPGTITVTLTSRTRNAAIFYTLDGWSPTPQSIPYTGPITISATQTLEAIAVAPRLIHSLVTSATYTLPAPLAVPAVTATAPVLLDRGTPIPLRFTAPVDSATAKVGETITLALAQNLILDGTLVAPAGAQAQAVITQVQPARRGFNPGSLSFTVQSIRLDGVDVALSGTRTRNGDPTSFRRQSFTLIPFVGVANLASRGTSAHIAPGDQLIATVAAPITLTP